MGRLTYDQYTELEFGVELHEDIDWYAEMQELLARPEPQQPSLLSKVGELLCNGFSAGNSTMGSFRGVIRDMQRLSQQPNREY